MPAHAAPPLFRADTSGRGFAEVLRSDPRSVRAGKLTQTVQVEFVSAPCAVLTPEGAVNAHPGDAIVANADGERWPIPAARFAERYQPVPPTRSGSPGPYVSLPQPVLARRMTEPFQVLLEDGLSRLNGQAGDWLVGTGNGGLHVVSAAAFARTYRIERAASP